MGHVAFKIVSRCLAIATISVCGVFPVSTAIAQAGTSLANFDNICLTEARRAEAQHGIPSGLLQSISRVEAGRKTVTGEFMPWAWTLNDRGEGLFFDSREAALKHLQAAVDAGDHSVDVGCMQVNTKWHLEGFLELSDMLDPVQNADYAAGFLLDLHEAHQSWDDAVKHYHSSQPEKNVRYHSRVLAELEIFLAGKGAAPTDDSQAVAVADDADLELASLTAPLPSAMPAPVAPPAPPMPMPLPGPAQLPMVPLALDQQVQPDQPDQPFANPGDGRFMASPSPAIPSPALPSPARFSAMDKQPNLVPHWNRVEKFRALLAREAS